MKKSYFLRYGSNVAKKEIKELFESKWDIYFSENDSLYFGVYFVYSGLHADKISITDNYISSSQEWLDERHSEYATLISASFVNGRNSDKLSRYKFVKHVIRQFGIASVLSDECVEEGA